MKSEEQQPLLKDNEASSSRQSDDGACSSTQAAVPLRPEGESSVSLDAEQRESGVLASDQNKPSVINGIMALFALGLVASLPLAYVCGERYGDSLFACEEITTSENCVESYRWKMFLLLQPINVLVFTGLPIFFCKLVARLHKKPRCSLFSSPRHAGYREFNEQDIEAVNFEQGDTQEIINPNPNGAIN